MEGHRVRRQRSSTTKTKQPEPLERIQPNAAGIDCGSRHHHVAVPVDRDPEPVRRFKTFRILSVGIVRASHDSCNNAPDSRPVTASLRGPPHRSPNKRALSTRFPGTHRRTWPSPPSRSRRSGAPAVLRRADRDTARLQATSPGRTRGPDQSAHSSAAHSSSRASALLDRP